MNPQETQNKLSVGEKEIWWKIEVHFDDDGKLDLQDNM
jgi:hypothetical protein